MIIFIIDNYAVITASFKVHETNNRQLRNVPETEIQYKKRKKIFKGHIIHCFF